MTASNLTGLALDLWCTGLRDTKDEGLKPIIESCPPSRERTFLHSNTRYGRAISATL
jgi:hypothetical protein